MMGRFVAKRSVAVLIPTAVMVAVVVSGCGSSSGDSSTTETTASTKPVGLVLTGPPNDNGYYQQVNDGLKNAAKKNGVTVNVVSNVGFEPAAIISATKNLAKAGNDPVIVDGASGNAAATVAKLYPDTQFVIHAAPPPVALKNLHAYVPQQGITSYVAGALAASLSKSKTVGFIGGLEDIPTGEAYAGYSGGAVAQVAGTKVPKAIIGSYSDPAKSKQAASAQIANGADAIYAYVDSGFLGAVQAVTESGKSIPLISGTVARCELSKDVAAATIADNNVIMADILSDSAAGKLPNGTTYYGVDDPKIQRVQLCPGWDTPENQKVVDDVTASITDGSVKLPKAITGR